jgi:hypothetical protein
VGRRGRFLLGFVALLVSISALVVILEVDRIRETRDNLIYDSKNHYLSCDKLPRLEEVERVVSEHQETVREIEQVKPGFIMFRIDTRSCLGQSDIVIEYDSHRDRLLIEEIINGDTFFGVHYGLRNI